MPLRCTSHSTVPLVGYCYLTLVHSVVYHLLTASYTGVSIYVSLHLSLLQVNSSCDIPLTQQGTRPLGPFIYPNCQTNSTWRTCHTRGRHLEFDIEGIQLWDLTHHAFYSLRRRQTNCQANGAQGFKQDSCRRRRQAIHCPSEQAEMDIYRSPGRRCPCQ